MYPKLNSLFCPYTYPHSFCFLCSLNARECRLSQKITIFDISLTCHPLANHQAPESNHSLCHYSGTGLRYLSPGLVIQIPTQLTLPLVSLLLPERRYSVNSKSDYVIPLFKILPWLPAALRKNMKLQYPSSSDISLQLQISHYHS